MTFKCEKCRDTGVIILDDSTARQCNCIQETIRKRKLDKLLSFADIPREFKELKVRDFNTEFYSKGQNKELAENAKEMAIKYITNFEEIEKLGKGLYMYSNTAGSGKTRMAISIGNALIKQHNKSVKYMTVKELLTEVQSTFNNKEKTAKDLQTAAREVDVLILDDLGVENKTAWAETILYEVIDYRNDNNKITFFTANNSIDQLDYHPRIKSRLKRMTTPVPFPEESIRAKIASQQDDDVLKIMFLPKES